jgi:predicted nucleic acid-binding protein
VRLVIDANILVSEAMRERGRAILGHPELEKRLVHFQNHRNLPDAIAAILREEAFRVVETNVTVVPKAEHAHLEIIAQRRIPRDPDDAPTVALALLLEADIWTLDSDFLGCGVATWITDTLSAELETARDG